MKIVLEPYFQVKEIDIVDYFQNKDFDTALLYKYCSISISFANEIRKRSTFQKHYQISESEKTTS